MDMINHNTIMNNLGVKEEYKVRSLVPIHLVPYAYVYNFTSVNLTPISLNLYSVPLSRGLELQEQQHTSTPNPITLK